MDEDMISQGPQFIEFMVNELDRKGVPVITPAGGARLPSRRHAVHSPCAADSISRPARWPRRCSWSAACAAWSAARSRNSATTTAMSVYANMELLRLAVPRRVFTLSQVKYAVDRIMWLYENRDSDRRPEIYRRAQDVALLLRQAGAHQRLAAQAAGQVPRRSRRQPVRRRRELTASFRDLRTRGDGVIPFGMEGVAADVESSHFGVADFHALGVGVFVEFAAHGEAGLRCRRRDQFDDRRSAGQRTPAPVLRDVTEKAMLDLVPLRRAGRIMANGDGQSGLVGEFLQFELPCVTGANSRAQGLAR